MVSGAQTDGSGMASAVKSPSGIDYDSVTVKSGNGGTLADRRKTSSLAFMGKWRLGDRKGLQIFSPLIVNSLYYTIKLRKKLISVFISSNLSLRSFMNYYILIYLVHQYIND